MPDVKRKPPSGTNQVQSFIFPLEWSREKVVAWLDRNSAFSGGIEKTGSSWRARQYNPGYFDPKSFKMITVGTSGVPAVRGTVRGRKAT